MKDHDFNKGLGSKREKPESKEKYEPGEEMAACGRKAKNCTGYVNGLLCPFCNLAEK